MYKYAFKDGKKTLITEENKHQLTRKNGYDIGVQKELDKPTVIEQAYIDFENDLKPIKEKFTKDEQLTFEIKRQEATRMKNEKGYISPFIEGLCKDGETVEELRDKILGYSDEYKNIYAKAEKKLRNKLDKINNT